MFIGRIYSYIRICVSVHMLTYAGGVIPSVAATENYNPAKTFGESPLRLDGLSSGTSQEVPAAAWKFTRSPYKCVCLAGVTHVMAANQILIEKPWTPTHFCLFVCFVVLWDGDTTHLSIVAIVT